MVVSGTYWDSVLRSRRFLATVGACGLANRFLELQMGKSISIFFPLGVKERWRTFASLALTR